MKAFKVERYQCEICQHVYDTEDQARECEKAPIRHDRGLKPGDIVLITKGDGAGQCGIVKRTGILNRDWGHYAWKRYWHTVYVDADVIGSFGTRMLTFDCYEFPRAGEITT